MDSHTILQKSPSDSVLTNTIKVLCEGDFFYDKVREVSRSSNWQVLMFHFHMNNLKRNETEQIIQTTPQKHRIDFIGFING